MEMTKQTYFVQCEICNKNYGIEANPTDVKAWEEGELIQDVMPYLTESQRELIISHTCQDCWTEMYGLNLDF